MRLTVSGLSYWRSFLYFIFIKIGLAHHSQPLNPTGFPPKFICKTLTAEWVITGLNFFSNHPWHEHRHALKRLRTRPTPTHKHKTNTQTFTLTQTHTRGKTLPAYTCKPLERDTQTHTSRGWVTSHRAHAAGITQLLQPSRAEQSRESGEQTPQILWSLNKVQSRAQQYICQSLLSG